MSDDADKLVLILPPRPLVVAPALAPTTLPREGVTQERLQSGFWTNISLSKLKAQISDLQAKIGPVLTDLSKSVADNMELDEVVLGLAISVEGDIGIASAGAEATIELTFKIKKTH